VETDAIGMRLMWELELLMDLGVALIAIGLVTLNMTLAMVNQDIKMVVD
jgi:hypothetical protein